MAKTDIRKKHQWIKTPHGISIIILLLSFILIIIGALSANTILHKFGKIIFLWSLAFFIFLNSLEGLKSGQIRLRSGIVYKNKKPVLFWMSVVVGFGFFLSLFIGGALLFM